MNLKYKHSTLIILFVLGCQKKQSPTQMEWSSQDFFDQNKISEIDQIKKSNKIDDLVVVK